MAKDAVLSFRIPSDLKEGLEKEAAADDRSVSSLVERILRTWLAERGHRTRGIGELKPLNPARRRAKLKMLEPRIAVLDPRTAKPPKDD